MKYQMGPELKCFLVMCGILPLFCFLFIRDCILSLLPRLYNSKKNITGQTVLITGAGSGIGRQLAIEFSKHSTCLALLDLNKNSLYQTQKLLNSGSKSFLYECDVSKREKVYEVAKIIQGQVGKVDILVNNAGIVSGKYLVDLSDEEILKTMEVNALAHFWLLKAFLPAMIETNKGHIVSIASQAGLIGLPKLADYCASKFAAVGLMESLAVELDTKGLDGIKTTIVCPNLVSTGLFEGSRTTVSAMLNPETVALETMNGVLENKNMVVIPKWTSIIFIFKMITPPQILHTFQKHTGIHNFMESFTGRTNKFDRNGNNGSKEDSSNGKASHPEIKTTKTS